jgi:transcription initiation factor TFIIA small subunit
MALTDTLDDLISERRIEPQLAMKILANFDRSITEVLADKVKARLSFKVFLSSQPNDLRETGAGMKADMAVII